MKKTLILILTGMLCSFTYGQSFMNYKDTINHFSINIPVGWSYGKDKEPSGVKLIAHRTPIGKSDTARFSITINIIETPGKDLNKTFSDFLRYLPNIKNYKLIDTGDTTLNGIKFKWLIESHEFDDTKHHNYDLVTLKDGKTYILTMVAFSQYFDIIKPLFNKIANSFILQ